MINKIEESKIISENWMEQSSDNIFKTIQIIDKFEQKRMNPFSQI